MIKRIKSVMFWEDSTVPLEQVTDDTVKVFDNNGNILLEDIEKVEFREEVKSVTPEEREQQNALIQEAVDFFRKLDDNDQQSIELYNGSGSLYECMQQNLLPPDHVVGICKSYGSNVNPRAVYLNAAIHLDTTGKDVIRLWNGSASIEDIIANRADLYFARLSSSTEFIDEIKFARKLYENATGHKTNQSLSSWFVDAAVAHACNKVSEPEAEKVYPQGLLKHLLKFKDYALGILKKAANLANCINHGWVDKSFVTHLDTAVFGQTSEWENIRSRHKPVKLAKPVKSFEDKMNREAGLNLMAKFEQKAVVDELFLSDKVVSRIAKEYGMKKEKLYKMANDLGAKKFKEQIEKDFDFNMDREIKNVHLVPGENTPVRIWVRCHEIDNEAYIRTTPVSSTATGQKYEKTSSSRVSI